MKISEIVSNLENREIFYFDRTGGSAFDFVFAKNLAIGETIIVKLPVVSANKRGVNDIGWLSDGDVTLYGTLAENPRDPDALCQEIQPNDDVNKVTSAIVIKNNGGSCRIEMRAILN